MSMMIWMFCVGKWWALKYHTPDGVLRLRFFADASPWTTGKGLKLLITSLACESEEFSRSPKGSNDGEDDDDVEDDDSIAITPPPESFQPPESELMQIFRNLTGKDQYQTVSLPPVYGLNYPTQLPSPPYPTTGTVFLPSLANQRPLPFYPGNDKQNVFHHLA
ncbi:hypothetical protein EVAR_71909_1 [Eumeta japonica]|uniref:Uncharacterized protein n=1 Tax=Eumeta variegata TaxID=151549 RepID=A0A4C1SCZ7_EUMVA|nr:hypothetical protein EVAR_71909_1 [Eumeta japonica]